MALRSCRIRLKAVRGDASGGWTQPYILFARTGTRGGPVDLEAVVGNREECFRQGVAAPLRRPEASLVHPSDGCFRGSRYSRGIEGALSKPSVSGRVAYGGGFRHVVEPRPQNAGLGHGGGAFVTPPGGGAQNGSVEKMWRREKCETKKEAPPQRERRPGRDSSPGCRRLLLFFFPSVI